MFLNQYSFLIAILFIIGLAVKMLAKTVIKKICYLDLDIWKCKFMLRFFVLVRKFTLMFKYNKNPTIYILKCEKQSNHVCSISKSLQFTREKMTAGRIGKSHIQNKWVYVVPYLSIQWAHDLRIHSLYKFLRYVRPSHCHNAFDNK